MLQKQKPVMRCATTNYASFITYVNSVPSQTGDGLEGQTTKTNGLDEIMKSVL